MQACVLCTPLHLSLFGSVAVEVVCEVLLVLQGDWKCVHAQHPAPAGADRLKQNYNKMHVTHLLLYMSHTCYCTCHNLLLYMSQPATVHVTHLLLYMSQPVTVHVTHLLLYMSHTCYCTCHIPATVHVTPATVHVTHLLLYMSLNWSTTLTQLVYNTHSSSSCSCLINWSSSKGRTSPVAVGGVCLSTSSVCCNPRAISRL